MHPLHFTRRFFHSRGDQFLCSACQNYSACNTRGYLHEFSSTFLFFAHISASQLSKYVLKARHNRRRNLIVFLACSRCNRNIALFIPSVFSLEKCFVGPSPA